MSELISRQKLIEDMKRKCVGNCLKCEHFTILSSDYHCGVIDDQPPADVPDANVGKWIPCSERLPEERQKVLVTLETFTGVRFVRTDQIVDGNWWQWNSDNVTAWMPLPEPYKETE